MLITALPMLAFALASAAGEHVSTPRDAQTRLAETLATADAIASVRANADGDHTITFVIQRDGEAYRVIATTDQGNGNGNDDAKDDQRVASLEIIDAGTADAAAPPRDDMSWLVSEMHDVSAIRTLVVDDRGHVTLGTSDGRRYAARPHRGPKGNAGAEARWAAAWDA